MTCPAGDPKILKHAQLVDTLLALPPHTAAAEASALFKRLNFGSTYAFAKLLTELLVDDPNTLPGIGKAIVRPSLIHVMAGEPYVG